MTLLSIFVALIMTVVALMCFYGALGGSYGYSPPYLKIKCATQIRNPIDDNTLEYMF